MGMIDLPLGLGGVAGILECTVVQEDVPLLLPIRRLTWTKNNYGYMPRSMCWTSDFVVGPCRG